MRDRFTVLVALAIVAATVAVASAEQESAAATGQTTEKTPAKVDRISRFGITWQFARPVAHGQFANGDPWVVGPVRIVAIEPKCRTQGKRTVNGSMINPSPKSGTANGYDSSIGGYDPKLNVALSISRKKPLVVQPHSSLVSTESTAEPERTCLEKSQILTVLKKAPPEGSFRPPYCGTNKTPKYKVGQLKRPLLKNLKPVEHTPDVAKTADKFARPWLDHIPNWMSQRIHAKQNMPTYGRDLGVVVSEGALMVHVAAPEGKQAAKEKLLIGFVQLGIDLYGVAANGGDRHWVPNGGHMHSRKWPILFAGLMLGDRQMQRVKVIFQEDGQTYYGKGWHGATALWGIHHATNPRNDHEEIHPSKWTVDGRGKPGDPKSGSNSSARSEAYRQCCNALAWAGQALAARLMDAVEVWNHPAYFDYMDRWMTEDWAPHAATISKHIGRKSGTLQGSAQPRFVGGMWKAYRGQIKPAGGAAAAKAKK